ncbi:UDP-N-acetylmuramoyl-L-alanine--D-glutamate ligase [Granulosicoccus antarcticus]|uniref:UDP-N-acetylmuramoylalanine--D-glutamate ligase n=1 Tax=Granulosicoccus antarcticus IMCC3135 TaxID=1192854 RepID=A0A2Z2NX16_9GAMM|nr:UDP-N-acetylmuramoyl-L-alanine--D-glutamate ligase [Granulosicoccus antarcticus]ASJ75889.1 UDP-N-acetylmuramoylalanine--D-glutamate ligase [Granulosicoccus antarcticus IMCC3135]
MHPHNLLGKRILIVGYGVTGASVARFLARYKVTFDVADQCDETTATTLGISLGCRVHTHFDVSVFAEYELLILSPGVPRAHPAVQAALAAGVDVIGDIELFAGVVDIPVIAVTGSNGKSSVVSWVAHVLKSVGIDAVACGNIGKPALDSLDAKPDVIVLELSSYQLESTRSLKPLSATVLNISDDHLDRYDDIEHYASVKRTIFNGASHCVANHDDKRTWPEATDAPCDYFTLSMESAGSSRWHRTLKQQLSWLCDDQYALMLQGELSVPGDHNAANALAVLALIEPLAIPFPALQAGLSGFAGLPHRTEFLSEDNGVRWYNDSKGTNVDACITAIKAMPGPVILIAGGISKDADFTPLRAVVQEHVRALVLIGRDRGRIMEQLSGAAPTVEAETLFEAVTLAREHAQAGDVVLLSPACSSFDMFRNFEDRGVQFAQALEQVLAA